MQEEETERLGEAASQLLQQVESTLLTAGLQRHLATALTSPRRSGNKENTFIIIIFVYSHFLQRPSQLWSNCQK